MGVVKLIIYIVVLCVLAACEEAPKTEMPPWHPVASENLPTIKVALRVNPASYYWQDGQATGFDYKLLQSFANHTNTKIQVVPVATAAKAVDLLKAQKVDMAAGALGATQQYTEHFKVSDPYYRSKQHLIYRHPDTKPRRFTEISLSDIDISANPNHLALLEKLNQVSDGDDKSSSPNPNIGSDDPLWYLHPDTPSHKLIEMINLGLIRYTLADAFELSATRFLYPYVKVAFTIPDELPVVWLFNRTPTVATSPHLVHLANDLFASMRENGELDRITKSHPGRLELIPYADKLTFIESAYRKLADHERYFKIAGDKYHLDWKLIAAIAYQESHWDSRAVSPTGVKGIMMLTKEIAQRYEVHERSDAYQSIMGGSKYLNELLGMIPPEVPIPDRIWMALSAYLAGYGHLTDAFRLTRSRGGNVNSWIDLRDSLKLLQQPEWYEKSRYGKPRDNVVSYINNIRNYQFLLSLLEDAISTEIPQTAEADFITPDVVN